MPTLFLFFFFLQVFTSTFIFFSINPIHSILLLILLFFESSIVLSLFSLEFVSILFIIIYVGAIAILFLFVIMMLQLKLNNLEVLFFFPIILSINMLIFFFLLHYSYPFLFLLCSNTLVYDESFNELFIISQFLYNYSVICFLLAGIILLLALLGSIIISLDFNKLHYNIIFKKLNRVSNFISFLR